MRRVLAFVFVAGCSSFAASQATPDNDAGTPDASTSDASVPETSAADASVDADAATDAGSVVPPGMIAVDAGPFPFAIDATEVTVEAWNTFAVAHPQPADLDKIPNLPVACAGHALPPYAGCTPPTDNPAYPQVCVDWCDATAYCLSYGKRLCGAIGGHATFTTMLEAQDPDGAQWMRACSTPTFITNQFPWGATQPDPSRCNTMDHQPQPTQVAPVGSFSECQGGEIGIFDLSGNATEWVDGCQTSDGQCFVQGGSYKHNANNATCGSIQTTPPGTTATDLGFRCCQDL